MNVAVVSSRTAGQIVLHLNPKQPEPALPYELHEPRQYQLHPIFFVTFNHHQVTADAWATRIPELIRVGSCYSRPLLEGIWLVVMFICALAVSIGLNDRIYQALEKKIGNDTFGAAYQTRQWEAEDMRSRAPGTFTPIWKAKLPAALSPYTRLTITTPHVQTQTYFHPAAYMPSWINGPADPRANDGFHVANQGFQKSTMYGEVPLYGNYDRNSSGALQPHGERGVLPYSDEKEGLQAIRI